MAHDIKTSLTFPETLHEVFWYVELTNGQTVYRNDVGEKDSWLVLKDYLEENKLDIVSLVFRFRDHYEPIGRDKKGFFFTKMILCHYGGDSKYYFLGGYVTDDEKNIFIKKFILPELLCVEEEYRPITEETERGLYWNRFIVQSTERVEK